MLYRPRMLRKERPVQGRGDSCDTAVDLVQSRWFHGLESFQRSLQPWALEDQMMFCGGSVDGG